MTCKKCHFNRNNNLIKMNKHLNVFNQLWQKYVIKIN